jgi:hypothetical protein
LDILIDCTILSKNFILFFVSNQLQQSVLVNDLEHPALYMLNLTGNWHQIRNCR